MDQKKPEKARAARLWKLFVTTLYISSFTFGGGFVIVTFMKKKFVDELHWIDEQEMLDMTALAQSSPGAIAVNAAILVGWQVEGLAGCLSGVAAARCPPHNICRRIPAHSAGYRVHGRILPARWGKRNFCFSWRRTHDPPRW